MDSNQKNQSQTVGIKIPSRAPATKTHSVYNQAEANLRRAQVERIYQGKTSFQTPQTQPVSESLKTYQATNAQTEDRPAPILSQNSPRESSNDQAGQSQNQDKNSQSRQLQTSSPQPIGAINYKPQSVDRDQYLQSQNPQGEQWKRYHQLWQNYYQKYYESYYVAAYQKQAEKLVTNIQPEVSEQLSENDKKARALAELRRKIKEKAREKTEKFRRSRHFAPIITTAVVVSCFLFLQYNRMIFATIEAYVSPGNADPQTIIQTPSASENVSQDPRLIIPKINVDVPVVYGVGSDEKSQLEAMNRGVSHFSIPGASSVPGQVGNTVLSGHSSNDLFDSGDYKFIFAQLDKVNVGDIFYSNYEGKRYTYAVRDKKVVLPTDVSAVVIDTDKPMMTLITCTPLGTAEKRLLIIAEQVSPDPSTAKPQIESNDISSQNVGLPRNSLTFFERLFSWKWD